MPSRRQASFALVTALACGWPRRARIAPSTVNGHVVLLGDSVFDNGAYTRGDPTVLEHLRASLPDRRQATLCARDGARVADLRAQLARVPADATDLVISLGGNDALANRDLLQMPVTSTARALDLLDERAARFESDYRRAVESALALRKHLVLCSIYNGNVDFSEARRARVALMIFNDAILRVAFEHAIDVIDLRLVCAEPVDYANAIEPSGGGGRKIAQAIVRACASDGSRPPVSRVLNG